MNIVLAASQSPALDRHDMREITSAMDRLLSQLDLPNNPSTRIAILDAPGEARTLVPLSNDEKLVRRGIHKVEMEGESNLASLLEEAGRHLRQGRADGCNEDSQEFLVLFAGDPDRRECVTAQRETNQLRRFGVRVITVCSGPRCRSGCMRDLASSARYAYSIRDASELIWVFGLIRDHIVNIGLRQLVVVEKLAAGGGFEPGSSSPAATWDVDAGTLTWQQNFVPRDGITVSYRTRPAGLGRVPVSGGLTLQWRDNQNRMGSATLNPPMVHVLGAPQSEP